MTLKTLLLAISLAGQIAAQTFIQMSDPQFGMYTNNRNFAQETANFDFAIATANRLKPAFVVVTGDLINDGENAAQAAEFHRIAAKLDPTIKLFNAPGNHDVGNEPTQESLARYRERFGPDYYAFRMGEMEGIVLNSNLEKGAEKVPEEAAKMEAWLKNELDKTRRDGVKNVIVFQHISFFLEQPGEADQYFNVPRITRNRYLKLLHDYSVHYVFAGHLHHNSEGRDGDLDMITTGPVGKPLDDGASGLRIVKVEAGGVSQEWFDFGRLPNQLADAFKKP